MDSQYRQAFTYLVFGALTTFTNITSYFIFSNIIGMNYLISNAIAWILSVMFAYVTNKTYVFRSKGWGVAQVIKEITTFTGCRLFSGGMDMAIMYIFIDLFKFNDLAVKVFANLLVIVANFIMSKRWVFQEKDLCE